MTQFNIYGIGAALLDTEIEVSDKDLELLGINKGVMTLVDEAKQQEIVEHLDSNIIASKRASGGSAANTVIAASYFGANTFYSCLVSNDQNGEHYLNDLAAANVKYHKQNGSSEGITGKCLVLVTPDAERTMNTFLGISEKLSESEIDEEALKQSEYVYIEGYLVTSETAKPAAISLRKSAEQFGVKTAISLSDPAMVEFFKEGLEEMIGDGVDLLFCNQDEATGFTQTNSLDEACEALKKHAKQFAVTLGGDGARLFDGEKYIEIAPNTVTPVDSNGAGDMFAGAFLYGISQGWNFEQAGKLASKASSVVVTQFGPRLAPEQHQEILKSI